jgi:threonyl-tRNA synthetase
MLLFGSRLRSYRELPIRYAESSTLHRNELAGTLHGLLRVRHVTQDDAHIFCTEEQVPGEIDACMEFAKDLYELFGVTPHAELSTRPEERLGTDEEWDHAEGILRAALERHEIPYVIGEGEGTFYAPKIDLHMQDALGRSWQMGTIQADEQMPRRFGLTYFGADNEEHTPVVIHRALLGSLERFVGILTEHYAGAFPFWLAPVQVRIVPVGEAHRAGAHEIEAAVREAGHRVEVDERDETVGRRIRDAELDKVPKTIVYGERESRESLAIRDRGGGQYSASLEDFLRELATLVA